MNWSWKLEIVRLNRDKLQNYILLQCNLPLPSRLQPVRSSSRNVYRLLLRHLLGFLLLLHFLQNQNQERKVRICYDHNYNWKIIILKLKGNWATNLDIVSETTELETPTTEIKEPISFSKIGWEFINSINKWHEENIMKCTWAEQPQKMKSFVHKTDLKTHRKKRRNKTLKKKKTKKPISNCQKICNKETYFFVPWCLSHGSHLHPSSAIHLSFYPSTLQLHTFLELPALFFCILKSVLTEKEMEFKRLPKTLTWQPNALNEKV